MYYFINISWIIEIILICNMVLSLFTGFDHKWSIVTTIIIITIIEYMKSVTNPFEQEEIVQNQHHLKDKLNSCSNTTCGGCEVVEQVTDFASLIACETCTELTCEPLVDIGCDTITEVGCEMLDCS